MAGAGGSQITFRSQSGSRVLNALIHLGFSFLFSLAVGIGLCTSVNLI